MGFGFIIGGFCPGTSLVAMATMKIDGLFFVLGAVFGIFLFGETVDSFYIFWNSSYFGRLMLPEWLGLDTGVVVLGVVLMALFMFWGGEQLERIIGKRDLTKEPKSRYIGAALLVVGAVAVLLIGQPTTLDRWLKIAPEKEALLIDRSVQIEPGELLHVMHDHELKLVMLDVRDEADYNLFHLADARRATVDELSVLSSELHLEPPETVFVLMSNDEIEATKAWKVMLAESVPNVYILEGGINGWLDIFAKDDIGIRPLEGAGEGGLRYEFASALGAAYQIADPDFHEYELEFTPKIKMELKRAPSGGGCG